MYPSALLLLLALPPIDGPVLDMCAHDAADASATLGVKDSVTLQGGSLGPSGYASSGCKRFIADFVVHPGAHAASPSMERSFRVDGGSVWTVDGANKDLCEQYSLAVKVYRRKRARPPSRPWQARSTRASGSSPRRTHSVAAAT